MHILHSGLVVSANWGTTIVLLTKSLACTMEESILTLNRLAHDHSGVWPNRGAGLITDEILQTVRDPVSLGSQSQVCL